MMKQSFIAILSTVGVFSPAQADLTRYYGAIDRINQYESVGNYNQALSETSRLVSVIHGDLRINSIATNVNQSFTEIKDEVVTETYSHSESESQSGNVDAWFASASLGYSKGSHKDYDVTKILSRNAKEASEFSAGTIDAIGSIQAQLKSYVKSNIDKIVLLKEAGQKAFQLASFVQQNGGKVSTFLLDQLSQQVMDINFIGKYHVTSCIQVNYTNRAKNESSYENSDSSFSFFFVNGKESSRKSESSQWKQFAHTNTTCSSDVNTAEYSLNKLTYSYDLYLADQKLMAWMKKAYAFSLFDLESEEPYPTFGLPVYRR